MSYDPTVGRWLEQDPDTYIDGPNRYQFEKSNPITGLDPTGKDVWYGPNWMNELYHNPPAWVKAVDKAINDIPGSDDDLVGYYGFIGVGGQTPWLGGEIGLGCSITSDWNLDVGLEGYGYVSRGVGPNLGVGFWAYPDEVSSGVCGGVNLGPIGGEALVDPINKTTYIGVSGGAGIVGGVGAIYQPPPPPAPGVTVTPPKPIHVLPYAPNWINNILVWAQS